MKKILKGIICAGLVGVIAAGTVGAAGCNNKDTGKKVYRDSEKQPLRLAIGAVDEKFNPLYYTSLNDGTIANLTQVSLITSDAEGNLVVGEDQPTVALDYLETYYSKDGRKLATGDGVNIVAEQGGNKNGDQDGYTTYEFLIKNGMKFSNGSDLTVMDVLFNLYVYLDPLYSGSNTIYSTRIDGLQAYRTNDPTAPDDGTGSSVNSTYYLAAEQRYKDLYRWADGEISTVNQDDLDKAIELYETMLNSDWNYIATSYTTVYEKYYFDTAWKAFFYMEGAVKNQKTTNQYGNSVDYQDAKGNYLTEFDKDWQTGKISDRGQQYINYMEEEVTEEKIAAHFATNPTLDPEKDRETVVLLLQKEAAVDSLLGSNTNDASGIKNILSEGSLVSSLIDAFYQDELSNAATSQVQVVKSIRGITVSHTTEFNGKTLSEDHDVLKIKVMGVDPKAKWNFGFSVAPMYYYSGTYGGKNYVEAAMSQYNKGQDCAIYDGTATEFGVKWSDVKFATSVLSSAEKNGLPMGAGAYKCTTYTYGGQGVSLNKGSFFYSNMAYFERNTNFETMGSEIENAKIKYVTYKVTNDDQIVNSLKTGEIDYGEPIAKASNQSALKSMGQITYETGGYGYVGINPKYVPDIVIRRAIMMAFDTSEIRDYYGNSLVNVIYKPMSNTSWIWTKNNGYVDLPTKSTYTYTSKAQDIIKYIEEESNGDWTYANGSWSNVNGYTLDFNFTIAGESVDHPAYDMFVKAKRILEQAGFKISVGTDPRALTKLVTGDLHVWAAAWSSSIDPDPYQIYSKYSNASSTKNWYKDGIFNDSTSKYAKEREIANALNDKIMEGRQTLDPERRSIIYAQSSTKANPTYDEMCALDLIMELAVEFPTYQRYDLCVYNKNVLDRNSMPAKPSHNMGPLSELWKVSYHVNPNADKNGD